MGNRYLDSGCATPTAPYESTTTAATSITGLFAGATVALGEIIWAKTTSAELYTANTTITPDNWSPAQPQQLLCVSDWDADPGTLSTGASVQTSESNYLTLVGSWYCHGIEFYVGASGTAGSGAYIRLGSTGGPTRQIYENCSFRTGYNGVTPIYLLGTSGSISSSNDVSKYTINNSTVYTAHINTYVFIFNNGQVEINNLSFDASSATPTTMFYCGAGGAVNAEVCNCDWSALAITNLVNVTYFTNGVIRFRNCKLPAGINVVTGTWYAPGVQIQLINCDSGDSYTRHETHQYEGVCSVVTSIYDTTTPADMSPAAGDYFSTKMVTTANTSKFSPLYSQWFCVWNDAAAKTPSVEVLVGADGASALNDDELWLEVDYNSGTDSPLGTRLTTCPGLLATPAACSAGTTAWTGDGYTTERTHKLSTAQITPDKPGFIWMRVALAKPSTTIYVNPPR